MKKLLLFFILPLLLSCTNHDKYFPKNLDENEVIVIRFDSVLLSNDFPDIKTKISYLYDRYPHFMSVYMESVIGISSHDTSFLYDQLPLFLEDTVYGFQQTNKYSQEVFQDISILQAELSEAFSKIKYLYPNTYIPNVYFFVSGFQMPIFSFENSDGNEDFAVGIDMYLGEDYPYYNQVVHNYQKHSMRPQAISGDVVSLWLFQNIRFSASNNRLIDNMIYRGKIMFILQQLLPMQSEYDIMGYTKQQFQWANQHEKDIWNLMMDRHDLFSTNHKLLTSYLNDAPFTAEVSQDSPPRLGTWIGLQIVKAYMKNNAEVSLLDLIEQNDTQYILQNSKYRP